MAKLVSKTYGDALFAVAMEENRVDDFYEAIEALSKIVRENEAFGRLMNHPRIAREDRVKIVEDTLRGRVPNEIVGMLTILVEKGHASEMLPVFAYFVERVKEEKKIGRVSVKTAVTLSDTKKAQIEKKILDTTIYETLEMCYEVDEALIGGMVIRIGDRVMDSSVKTKLYELTRELRNVQI